MSESLSPASPAIPSQGWRTPKLIRSILSIGLSASVGAIVFALSDLGRVTPASMTRQWLFLFLVVSVCLAGWAVLYALARLRFTADTREMAFQKAAIAHLPLLLLVGLIVALYASDSFNHYYSVSVYGRSILGPLVKTGIVLVPALLQVLLLLRRRTWSLAAVLPIALIVLFSFALRIWNINWALPALLHPDEHHYIGRGFVMFATGDLNPHYFKNPSLMIYLLDFLYSQLSQKIQLFHVAAEMVGMAVQDPRSDYLVVLAARTVSATAGTLSVLAIYLAVKELFGRRTALFSAAILGVCFLHVRNSHYTTNDVTAAFFMALSFLFAARAYRRGRTGDYMLAGLIGGLGTATKYNMGFFCVAILVAHLLRLRKNRGSWGSWHTHTPLALSAVTSLAGYLIGTPFTVLDPQQFLIDFRAQYDVGGESWLGQNSLPSPLLYWTTLIQGFGLVPLILAGLAIVLAWRRDRPQLLFVLSVPVAYLLFMSTQHLYFARFALPLLPFLAILAGYAISQLTVRSLPGAWQSSLQIAFLGIAIAQPLAMSVQSDRLLGMEDTRSFTATWIEDNLPPDASIAMEAFAHLDNKFNWTGYSGRNTFVYWPESDQRRAQALDGNYQYIVISTFGYATWQLEGAPPSALPEEYIRLEKEGELLVTISPGPANSDLPYSQDDMYTPFWHLFDRERPGPTVKIYRMGG